MKKILYAALSLALTAILISATTSSPASPCDSPVVGDHSGAPGETNCSGCHSSPVNPDQPALHFEFENAPVAYKPDSVYLMHLKIKRAGHTKFGFVCTSLDPSNAAAGSFSLINTSTTRIYTMGGRRYVSHTPCGADSQDSMAWTYQWKAPATNKGKIKFYLSTLVANHDHALTGDTTYTRTLELDALSQPLGIKSNEANNIKFNVFPTLFTNGFTIDFTGAAPGQLKTISLHNIQGKLMLKNSTTNSSHYQSVDETIPNGIYFLMIDVAGKKQTCKILKQ